MQLLVSIPSVICSIPLWTWMEFRVLLAPLSFLPTWLEGFVIVGSFQMQHEIPSQLLPSPWLPYGLGFRFPWGRKPLLGEHMTLLQSQQFFPMRPSCPRHYVQEVQVKQYKVRNPTLPSQFHSSLANVCFTMSSRSMYKQRHMTNYLTITTDRSNSEHITSKNTWNRRNILDQNLFDQKTQLC